MTENEIVKYQALVRCGDCGEETMVTVPQRKCQNPKCGKPLAVVVRTTEPADISTTPVKAPAGAAKENSPEPKPAVVPSESPPPIVDLDSAAGLGESEESGGGIFDKKRKKRNRT